MSDAILGLIPDWEMPAYNGKVQCENCGERNRPIAYLDGDECHLSIGCSCGVLYVGIEWPFVNKTCSVDDLEALGFEVE